MVQLAPPGIRGPGFQTTSVPSELRDLAVAAYPLFAQLSQLENVDETAFQGQCSESMVS